MTTTTPDALPVVAWLYYDDPTDVLPTGDDALSRSVMMSLQRHPYRNETPMARLSDAQAIIERLTAERDALRDVIDGTLAQAVASLEKCEAERDAALEDVQHLRNEVDELLEDARRLRGLADLWYFAMYEAPREFERIVAEYSPAAWMIEIAKVRRAQKGDGSHE